MSDAAQNLMTVDEFLATADERDGRWELEHGVAYAMAPELMGHARAKGRTYRALGDAIRRAGLDCEAVTDSLAVRITPRTAYQPDAMVYCGSALPDDVREVGSPVIIAEVLSPSTEMRDTLRKLIAYFTLPSVIHYLVLDPRDRALVHHKRGEGGLIETRPLAGGPLRLDPPGLDLVVEDLFGEA
jgi:Uma2 family endonuclease